MRLRFTALLIFITAPHFLFGQDLSRLRFKTFPVSADTLQLDSLSISEGSLIIRDKQNNLIVLTLPSQTSLQAVKSRVKQITTRQTTGMSLEQLLFQLNPVLRGWSYYFRFDAAKHTLSYLDYYVWRRVFNWMRKKHPKLGVRALRRKYFPDWQFRQGRQTLFRPAKLKVERYRSRGRQIPNPWQEEKRLVNPTVWDESQRLEVLEEQCCRKS